MGDGGTRNISSLLDWPMSKRSFICKLLEVNLKNGQQGLGRYALLRQEKNP
jgi:hypothetical protein